jgi:hypothetical protein
VGLDLVGLGVAGARGSVTSSHSLNIGQQAFTTIGIYKVRPALFALKVLFDPMVFFDFLQRGSK